MKAVIHRSKNPNLPRILAVVSILIAFFAVLAPPRAHATATASDDACNDSPISSGGNGGTGFAAWTSVATGGGGFYTAGAITSETGCSSAWGMYPSGAATVNAQRPFTNSGTLSVGQTISVDMANGGINSGGSEGMSLYNSSGTAVFEFYYANGNSGWTIHDSSGNNVSTVPYEGEPKAVRVLFTLTSSTTYSLTVQAPIGTTSLSGHTGTLISASPQAVSQLRFYAYDIGSGNNLEVGQIGVSCPTPTVTTQPSSTSTCAGSTASFTAASTTAASPTYQWQVSTNSGSTWANVSTGTGGTTGTYSTATTTTNMNGYEYRCVVTDACGTVIDSSAATLTVPNIAVAPSILPTVNIGVLYDQSLLGSGGTSPYTFALTSGALPTGLGLTNGEISGTYSGSPGSASFTITATDHNGCTGSQAYTVSMLSCPTITLSPSSLPNGTVDVSYGTQTISASGGASPYTFVVTVGVLPAGLSLNSSTGAITGTPTSSASQTFTVTATDNNGCTGIQSYTVTPACPTITVSGAPPSGTTGTAYSSTTFTASGANGSYTYSKTSGTLPPGLVLSSGGVLSGTPTAAGIYNFTVTATDTSGCTGSETNSVTISCPAITVSPASLPIEAVNVAYSVTFASSGGSGASSFTNVGALPTGLTLATNGLLSGTPTVAGNYSFTITATDTNGCTGSTAYSFAVDALPAITTNPQPQTVCSGSTATFTVAASGTSNSYAWYKHANTGWGSAWSATGSGTMFLDNSTNNDNNAAICGSFGNYGDINTPSGKSWGLYGGTNGDEIATRTFPAALTNGQIFQIDMDNGFVNTGLQVGFSLHNASNNLLLSFYFQGGGSDYVFYDGAGHTTSVGYTANGLRARVIVGAGSPASYVLLITTCEGSTAEYSGTFATNGTPDSVLLYNHNTSGGANYNLYFNSMYAGSAYDNADNYSGGWSGIDKGDTTPIPGATGTNYSTSTGNNGDLYYAIASNSVGDAASTNALLTVNQTPSITNASTLAAGTVGTAYSLTLASTGGASPYTYTVGSGLPTGISLSANGVLSGTPTAAGTYNFTVTVTDNSSTHCDSSSNFSLTMNCPAITVSPSILPTVNIGVPYYQTVTASGGTSPYTIVLTSGALPAGLGLTNGVISGTYNGSAGSATFTLTATDSNSCTGSQSYTLNLLTCPTITLSPSSLPNGTIGLSYGTQTISASGGASPYTYAVTIGTLPAGLSFNTNTGAITGTPTSDVSQTFTVTTTDTNGCTGFQSYTVTPACPTITVSGAPPAGTTGTAYTSTTFTASGANGSFTFSKTSGTLPPGLALSSGGVLSGTPTAAGTYNFTVTATDTSGCTGSETNSVTISCPTITVSPSNLPIEAVNVAYSTTFVSTGGSGASTFTNVGALPTGLTLATNGLLSGSPTVAGNYSFTITATDTNGCAGSTAYSVAVDALPAITINPQPQTVCSGSTANFTVAASGTSNSYAWYKHANAGWGSAWSGTGSGTMFLDNSTNNNNDGAICGSFSSFGDINTPSGNSWGIYGGANGDELVSRTFPAALTNGQVFQIDMDNGFVDTGDQVGFSLHNASNNLLLSFYFQGGGSDYIYYDGASNHATSVGYTQTGLRIQVIVGTGNPASYVMLISACGGNAFEYSGTFATNGTPDSVLLYNHNTSGGDNFNLYFNSIYAGTAYDNADNYSGGWSGDKGDATPLSGDTNSSFSTATGNNGDLYYAIANNAVGDAASTNALLTVNQTPSITNVSPLTAGTAGTAYSLTLASTGGTSPYTYTVGSGLPPGISLSTNGVLSGTPTTPGTYNFTVTVTDSSSTLCESSTNLSLIINCPAITVLPGTLPAVNIGVPYNQTVTASGGTSPYTIAVTSGALPTGLGLTNGVISGTYNGSAGSATFTLTATDSNFCTGSQSYTINLFTCPTITVSPSSLPNGTVGSSFGTQTISASGGASPYTFAVTSGTLPAGLSLNTSTGAITGTPTSSASQTFTVTATDTNGCTGFESYTVTPACPTITVAPASLPNLVLNAAIGNVSNSASGGTAPYTYTLSGSVPPGLSIISNTGALSGAPTNAGAYTFTVTATDTNGCTGSTSYSLTVGTPPSIAVQPTNASICTGSTATFAATAAGDGTISYAWRKTGTGWGFPWSITGNNFLGSSTDNDQGNPACSSFGYYDINSASGNAWGMYGPATAVRGFPALTAGQVFRIDVDNGNVDVGAKNGFRLQQASGPTDIFKFYFLGGQNNYKYWDSAGEHDTGIPFTLTGLKVEFLLGATTNYTIVVTPCGGSATQFFGALPAGTMNQVLLECNNAGADCGGCDNLYFNNILAGNNDDNAGFYTGALGSAGNTDLGSTLAASGSGATNDSYTTPALNYPGDNGNVYQLLVYSPYGEKFSSLATAAVNPYPGAPTNGLSTNVAPTLDLMISIASVLSNWQGSGLSLESVDTNSAQGGTVFADTNYIYYIPPTNSITNDSFTYTVVNASGCATTATISLTFVAQGGIAEAITVSNNTATIVFYGIPGVQYDVQRTTSLESPIVWTTLTTGAPLTASNDGIYTFTDNSATNGVAFYRSLQH